MPERSTCPAPGLIGKTGVPGREALLLTPKEYSVSESSEGTPLGLIGMVVWYRQHGAVPAGLDQQALVGSAPLRQRQAVPVLILGPIHIALKEHRRVR